MNLDLEFILFSSIKGIFIFNDNKESEIKMLVGVY